MTATVVVDNITSIQPEITNMIASSSQGINVDVLIVGGGLSGISTLHRLRKLGLKALIFESGADFGGVWHHNRYPGARVDSEWPYYQLNIPEVYNTFCFTERFPGGEELRRYVAHVDKVLDLRKDTIFNASVNDCSWDENLAQWTVKTEQGHIARCRYLVLCSGLLHRRHYPAFPGLDKFRGQIVHSGFWSEGIETKGKKVALIGAGATAVQITQEVAKEAEQLTIFMRRPSYCMPMSQRTLSELENKGFQLYYDALFRAGRQSFSGFPGAPATKSLQDDPPEEREKAMNETWTKGGFQFLSNYTHIFKNKEASKIAYEFWSRKTRERMRPGKKRDLVAPTPDKMPYYFGSKRTPLEQDYYEMLDKDSVDIVDMNENKIKTFTTDGLMYEDGSELKFDTLILATGFDSYSGSVSHMGLKDRNGIDIKERWKDGIKSYLGMTFEGFPNTFMVYSPHAPTSLTNGTTLIETQADLVTQIISTMQIDKIKSLMPYTTAQESWTNMVDEMGEGTLFLLTNSWWTGGNIPGKKVQMLTYTAGVNQYEAQCKALIDRLEGFEIKHEEPLQDWESVVCAGSCYSQVSTQGLPACNRCVVVS